MSDELCIASSTGKTETAVELLARCPWKTKRLEVTRTLEREKDGWLASLGLKTEKREKDEPNAGALVLQASPSFLLPLLVRAWGQ